MWVSLSISQDFSYFIMYRAALSTASIIPCAQRALIVYSRIRHDSTADYTRRIVQYTPRQLWDWMINPLAVTGFRVPKRRDFLLLLLWNSFEILRENIDRTPSDIEDPITHGRKRRENEMYRENFNFYSKNPSDCVCKISGAYIRFISRHPAAAAIE